MLRAERYKRILNLINERGVVSITELCEMFNASRATVRRDLAELDGENLLERTHGGAVAVAKPTTADIPLALRQHIQKEEKMRIARAALDYIEEGSTVYLGTGTTAWEVAAQLHRYRQLTVLTNDIAVAMEVSSTKNQLIVAGGALKKTSSMTLLGYYAEHIMSELHVDITILSVDVVDLTHGFMDSNTNELSIKRLMIKNSRRCIMLCDHTKFNKSALVTVCPFDGVDMLITDGALDPNYRHKISEAGVEIVEC